MERRGRRLESTPPIMKKPFSALTDEDRVLGGVLFELLDHGGNGWIETREVWGLHGGDDTGLLSMLNEEGGSEKELSLVDWSLLLSRMKKAQGPLHFAYFIEYLKENAEVMRDDRRGKARMEYIKPNSLDQGVTSREKIRHSKEQESMMNLSPTAASNRTPVKALNREAAEMLASTCSPIMGLVRSPKRYEGGGKRKMPGSWLSVWKDSDL